MNRARAAYAVMTAALFTILSFTPAVAGVSDKERALGACIIRALNENGWKPIGSFVPWGEHTSIDFAYHDKAGSRKTQTIYIFSKPPFFESDVLVFGMALSRDGPELEIAKVIERACQVEFSPMVS